MDSEIKQVNEDLRILRKSTTSSRMEDRQHDSKRDLMSTNEAAAEMGIEYPPDFDEKSDQEFENNNSQKGIGGCLSLVMKSHESFENPDERVDFPNTSNIVKEPPSIGDINPRMASKNDELSEEDKSDPVESKTKGDLPVIDSKSDQEEAEG
jgi:hypothetical protein